MDQQLLDELKQLGQLHTRVSQHSVNATQMSAACESHGLTLAPEGLAAYSGYPSNTNTTLALEAIDAKIMALVAAAAAAIGALIVKLIDKLTSRDTQKTFVKAEEASDTFVKLDPNKPMEDNKRWWELFKAKMTEHVEANAVVRYASRSQIEFLSIMGSNFSTKIGNCLSLVEQYWHRFEDDKLDNRFLDTYYGAIDDLKARTDQFKVDYTHERVDAHIPSVLATMAEVKMDEKDLKKRYDGITKTLDALRKELRRIDRPGRLSLKPKHVQAQIKAFREGILICQNALTIQDKLMHGYIKIAEIARTIKE